MPRCYYYAIRQQQGVPQILCSHVSMLALLNAENTWFLPDRRTVLDCGGDDLEWCSPHRAVSQAAIALLGHATTGELITRRYALDFQREVLSNLSRDGWVMRADHVRQWVARKRRQTQKAQNATLLAEPMD
jgi:hypothetical protein